MTSFCQSENVIYCAFGLVLGLGLILEFGLELRLAEIRFRSNVFLNKYSRSVLNRRRFDSITAKVTLLSLSRGWETW